MRAMILEQVHKPLVLRDCPMPKPASDQVQLAISACAVCRTDLHVIDGELSNPKLPLIIGHEIVGRISQLGDKVQGFEVGSAWACPG